MAHYTAGVPGNTTLVTRSLPAELKADLPSVDDLEAELADPNREASEA